MVFRWPLAELGSNGKSVRACRVPQFSSALHIIASIDIKAWIWCQQLKGQITPAFLGLYCFVEWNNIYKSEDFLQKFQFLDSLGKQRSGPWRHLAVWAEAEQPLSRSRLSPCLSFSPHCCAAQHSSQLSSHGPLVLFLKRNSSLNQSRKTKAK